MSCTGLTTEVIGYGRSREERTRHLETPSVKMMSHPERTLDNPSVHVCVRVSVHTHKYPTEVLEARTKYTTVRPEGGDKIH